MSRAYSYVRFSHHRQTLSDSVRRQTEAANTYCKANGLTLDEGFTLRDLGVSAFRGKHAQTGALATFLDGVRTGRVARGSVLLVENMDRLSRQDVDTAYDQFRQIIKGGVDIVTLQTGQRFNRASLSNPMELMLAVWQMYLAHEESRKKSDRLQKAWAEKKKKAAGKAVSRRAWAWLEYDDEAGRFKLVPERAKIVRRVFAMAAAGMGVGTIAARLNADGITSFARGGSWNRVYLNLILRSRAVLGEYQPCTRRDGKRVADGPPVPGYYPAVVTEDVWYAALNARQGKKRVPQTRHGEVRNLFSGLLTCENDGTGMYQRVVKSNRHKYISSRLVSAGWWEGHADACPHTLNYDVFESAMLDCLSELRPRDVTGSTDGDGPENRQAALSGRLAELDHRIERLKARVDGSPDVDSLLDLLVKAEREKKTVSAALEKARAEQTSTAGEVLGELQSVVDLLGKAKPDDVAGLRLRIKARLPQLVESISVFLEPSTVRIRGKGTHKPMCAVITVRFVGSAPPCQILLDPQADGSVIRARVDGDDTAYPVSGWQAGRLLDEISPARF